jgi:Holliday junction resolvasome RuvABC endonuclease subunit
MSVFSIGIDPGVSGAVAWVDHQGLAGAEKLKGMTDRDVFELLVDLRLAGDQHQVRALLEEVHSMPRQGVASTFKFGVSFGSLRMALVAAAVPFELITPAKWQQAMRCRSKGDKNVTKARAQELFPSLKITHATADALLLAELCRRRYNGSGA